MNIFVLDRDPEIAARYLNDIHAVKMVLETAQLLSTAVWLSGGSAPYKMTHKNHPCSLWTRQSRSNFEWLVRHGLAIAKEYSLRYGKTHKSEAVIVELSKEAVRLPDKGLTEFALVMPEEYRMGDAVMSYRNFYKKEKAHLARWRKGAPAWWNEVGQVCIG